MSADNPGPGIREATAGWGGVVVVGVVVDEESSYEKSDGETEKVDERRGKKVEWSGEMR